jgi:dihydrofolate reductase
MISLIVAIASNNVIGKDNELPWYYKSDLKYFKDITTNHTIVMGRKTFDSIIARNGKILPNRKSVVVTRNKDFKYADVSVIHNIKDFLKQDFKEEIFIIGGYEIFKESLPYVDKLYITHIDKDYVGDVYFPEYKKDDFRLISKKDDGELSFCVYERVIK